MSEEKKNGSLGSKSGPGNTRGPNVKKWIFTLHLEDFSEMDRVATYFEKLFEPNDRYFFAFELGSENSPHFQGFFKLEWRKRLTALKKRFGDRPHFKKMKGTWSQNLKYCTKEHYKFWCNFRLPREIVWPEEWYPWQEAIIRLVNEPNDWDSRRINWIWCENGCTGKTTLMKYLMIKHEACSVVNKTNDAMHLLLSRHQNELPIDIICFNFSRTMLDRINYGSMEQIKDGLIISGKYEGGQLVIACPLVLVFANAPPNLEAMSLDRWNVIKLQRGVDL